MRLTSILATTTAAALIGFAGTANAEVLVSMTYDDLSGSYNHVAQQFTAAAVDNAFLRSAGDSSRLVGPTGSAHFSPGFVSLADLSNFVLTCSVIPTGVNTASGTGTFTATDADGDTVTGDITGVWGRPAPGFIFFNGVLSNVFLNGTSFDGSNGGSWDMNLPGDPPYEGALVQLVFGGSTFFTSNFSNRAVGVTAQIIPTPGALALLGIAGVFATRRRTR